MICLCCRPKGFSGIVTYGATDVLGSAIPVIASELGFKNLIVGIWNPLNDSEIKQAEQAAKKFPDLIKGFVVGNEGLEENRYSYEQLNEKMESLKKKTHKPVTTSEDSKFYDRNSQLLNLGDWLFPNTHPYWAGHIAPRDAVQWTKTKYEQLSRSGKRVSLEESWTTF